MKKKLISEQARLIPGTVDCIYKKIFEWHQKAYFCDYRVCAVCDNKRKKLFSLATDSAIPVQTCKPVAPPYRLKR